MSRDGVLLALLRKFVREHERLLIVAWLAGALALLGVLFTWGLAYRGAERVVDAALARWPQRIDECRALVERAEGASGAERLKQLEAAAERLEQLDAEFPARTVKHRLDRERERLLTLLAATWTRLDRKRRATEAAARLVAFDPRNWQNHRVQAETAAAFGDGDGERLSLDRLLAIHPTHLPSVEDRIRAAFDGGRFAEVPPLWRAYLDAHRIAALDVVLGETRATLEVPADGRPHRFRFPFALAAGARGELAFETHGWSCDVRGLSGVAPLLAGVVGTRAPFSLGDGPWRASGARELGAGSIAALEEGSLVAREIAAPESGVAELEVELVVYKACTDSLRERVEKSYRNRLLWDELEAVRARTRVGGTLAAGSLFEE